MTTSRVEIAGTGLVRHVALNDPARRNALGLDMFDAVDGALAEAAASEASVLLLSGRGPAFCSGFDLSAAGHDPAMMATFIERLSFVLRTLRRMPQVVIGVVQGAAVAGGCAIVSACDLVVVSATARLGYPVHQLGVSPAVTIPTLQQAIGPGAARALLVGGRLIDGRTAARLGLATHVSPDDDTVASDAERLCTTVTANGPAALRVTKAWLNELDQSLDDARFDGPMKDSAELARAPESQRALAAFLTNRAQKQ